jgi:hypothetical protein
MKEKIRAEVPSPAQINRNRCRWQVKTNLAVYCKVRAAHATGALFAANSLTEAVFQKHAVTRRQLLSQQLIGAKRW